MTAEQPKGMYFSDRCQFCHDFGEKAEPYLCPKCKIRIKELGYALLADDQSLPPTYFANRKKMPWISDYDVEKCAQQDMLKQGWKKVVDNQNPV